MTAPDREATPVEPPSASAGAAVVLTDELSADPTFAAVTPRGWRRHRTIVAVVATIVGVVTFWFNFVGVNLLFSGMHSYSGI